MGFGMAATAMISRRVGEKNEEGAAVAAVNVLYIGIVISLLIS